MRATSQTVAYFCRDKEHLYIGLHAAAPAGVEADDQSKRITSDVEYDGLMPVGEDLIEVVLDPTNRGTRPDDLFHVVLKSNGIAISADQPNDVRCTACGGSGDGHGAARGVRFVDQFAE